jgi:hypothetical protein
MFHAKKVKIDVDYVNRYLEKKLISKKQFSEMNGHSNSWWSSIEKKCDCMVAVNQANLICTLTGLDYEKLVIPEHTTSNAPQNEQKSILEEDETLLKALVNCMNRIEKKMDEATIDLTRLEIQMRTVLKEMGVK